MKIIRLYLLIFLTFFLIYPANSTKSVDAWSETSTFDVINSSPYILTTSGNQFIDMEGLTWVGGGVPW
ncbi:MAG: hypothetical protein V7750_19830, partial [Sneathiella sp.]